MKGVAWTWIMVFVTLAVVGIIYIPLTEVLEGSFFPTAKTWEDPQGNLAKVIDLFQNSWYWGIVIFVFGLFVWAILYAQKRVPETGYYFD